MGAALAKAQFLQLLDTVERERKVIPITKRGRVVAHLVPVPEEKPISNFDRIFGESRGRIKITGDIVSPDWEGWGPEWR
jgi:prevent-host-death family protein